VPPHALADPVNCFKLLRILRLLRILPVPEARRGRADLTGDVERVARPRAAARQDVPRPGEARDGDVHEQRSRRSCDVAACQRHARLGRERQETVEQGVHVGGRHALGETEREQGQPRRAAHRGNVGQVDGERLPADVVRRADASIEVNAFDHRVGGEDLERAALRLHHRRIVADAHRHPGGRGADPRADLLDQRALSGCRAAVAGQAAAFRLRATRVGGLAVAFAAAVGRKIRPASGRTRPPGFHG
jgi:hypothetical protein